MYYSFPPIQQIGDLSGFMNMFASMLIVFVIFFVIFLVVWILISLQFSGIASKKGYSKVGFFFATFFLGVIGCIWIAALKDKVMESKLDRVLASLDGQGKLPTA
jgi:hypothetical protein